MKKNNTWFLFLFKLTKQLQSRVKCKVQVYEKENENTIEAPHVTLKLDYTSCNCYQLSVNFVLELHTLLLFLLPTQRTRYVLTCLSNQSSKWIPIYRVRYCCGSKKNLTDGNFLRYLTNSPTFTRSTAPTQYSSRVVKKREVEIKFGHYSKIIHIV